MKRNEIIICVIVTLVLIVDIKDSLKSVVAKCQSLCDRLERYGDLFYNIRVDLEYWPHV